MSVFGLYYSNQTRRQLLRRTPFVWPLVSGAVSFLPIIGLGYWLKFFGNSFIGPLFIVAGLGKVKLSYFSGLWLLGC